MTSPPPRSMLDKVREDLAQLPESQRQSAEVLLIEHLAQLVDSDPNVAAIKALRVALAAITPKNENTAVDEIQRRRARRQQDAASTDSARPAVRDDSR